MEIEDELKEFCVLRLKRTSERALNVILMELRKLDRDRERIIHPMSLTNLIKKHRVPVTSCLAQLYRKFEDPTLAGFVNYEAVIR